MSKMDKQIIDDSKYSYIGINTKKKQREILNLISYMKEVRDTAYPLKNSTVSELKVDSFVARKEKDIILVNGDLLLVDNELCERRTFEAYIMNIDSKVVRVYMDITRERVSDEPKMIRTMEEINLEDGVTVVTKYNQMEGIEEKTFMAKIDHADTLDFYSRQNVEQLSVL